MNNVFKSDIIRCLNANKVSRIIESNEDITISNIFSDMLNKDLSLKDNLIIITNRVKKSFIKDGCTYDESVSKTILWFSRFENKGDLFIKHLGQYLITINDSNYRILIGEYIYRVKLIKRYNVDKLIF